MSRPIIVRTVIPAILLAALTAGGLASPGGATASRKEDAPPALPSEQRILLEEAFHLAGTLGPAVWPGYDGSEAPVLLVAGEHEFLLNREEAPGGFRPAGGYPFRGRPVFVRPRQLRPTLLATFPALGFDTVVVGTAGKTGRTPAHWVVTVAHEMFHVFQGERGLNEKVAGLAIGAPNDSSWHMDFPFPYEDAPVRSALHLLGYSLYRTAAPADPDDSAALSYDARTASEAIDLLDVVLSARHGDSRNMSYLRYQTAKEGVARYVEYRLARAAASGDYRPTEAFRQVEGAGAYRDLWEDAYASMLYQVKHLGSVSRSRLEFYSLGLGMALTLDSLDADWKEATFEPGIWLDDLLRAATAREAAGCALDQGM